MSPKRMVKLGLSNVILILALSLGCWSQQAPETLTLLLICYLWSHSFYLHLELDLRYEPPAKPSQNPDIHTNFETMYVYIFIMKHTYAP